MKNLLCNATKWLSYALVLLCCLSGVAVGLPAGGIISVGIGSIASSGDAMSITSDAPGTVIDWTNFSIGVNEIVSIVQPSFTSTVLLRVIGADSAQMLGKLQSNGRVFLVSPSGILFGSSATVDASGLISSTLDISNQNFLANQLQFASGVDAGGIVNQGRITAASGGSVYLLSPYINNEGSISAAEGEILLAAGNTVMDLTTPGMPIVADAAGTTVSPVFNNGKLLAQDGKVGVYGGLINQSGMVNADAALLAVGGTIIFSAATDTTFSASSVISAKGGGIVVYGGSGTVAVNGALDVQNGGTVTLNSGTGTYGSFSSTGLLNQSSTGSATSPDIVAGTITVPSSGTNIGTVTLGGLNQTYSGSVPEARCTTIPAHLSTSISYSDIGSGPLSKNVGNYGATCTVTQPGYSSSVSGTLVISPLSLNVASGVNVYDATAAGVLLSSSGIVLGDTVTFAGTNTRAGTINTSGVSATGINTSYAASNYGVIGTLNIADTFNGATITAACLTCMTIAPTLIGSAVPDMSTFASASGVLNPTQITRTGITFSPTVLTVGGTTTATIAFTDGTGKPVSSSSVISFSSTTPSICTVYGNTISSIAAGTCILAVAVDNIVTPSAIVAGSTLNLEPSWNLLGNSIYATLDVAVTFGDANKVSSVWKWMPATSKWAFYAPSLAASGTLADYAASKGYDVLGVIDAGEGFWVNATAAFSVTLPSGLAVDTISLHDQLDPTKNKLIKGWSLLALSDNLTPSAFNVGLSTIQPVAGVIPLNVTTLWAWDSALSNWYFYAPSLDAQGGTVLIDYIAAKGYLDFTAANKTLGPGMGFWVNKP